MSPSKHEHLQKFFKISFVVIFFIVFSAIITLLIADFSFRFKHDRNLEKDIRVDKIQTYYMPRKNLILMRTNRTNRCFILPIDKQGKNLYTFTQISNQLFEKIGGPRATRFCNVATPYLLGHMTDSDSRVKRQDLNLTTSDQDGLALSYDERTPRCMDLLLDCSKDELVESQLCYTWINGVMRMDQSCTSSTEFKITLQKPRGRILKIQQEQWKICLERRRNGLKC